MKLYLDTCVLVSLFIKDRWSEPAFALVQSQDMEILVSDFAAAEFASAIALRVRTRALTEQEARNVFGSLDGFLARLAGRVDMLSVDVSAATAMLRRLDTPLRTGDALNIAIADRVHATLATFDRKMAEAAAALGVHVIGQPA